MNSKTVPQSVSIEMNWDQSRRAECGASSQVNVFPLKQKNSVFQHVKEFLFIPHRRISPGPLRVTLVYWTTAYFSKRQNFLILCQCFHLAPLTFKFIYSNYISDSNDSSNFAATQEQSGLQIWNAVQEPEQCKAA